MSLRSVLLAVLSREPNTGYGVGRLLRTTLSHLWQARLQQIYSELARMEAKGLVQVEVIQLVNRPAKKLYSLTPAGAAALDEWLAQPSGLDVPRDDLLAKLYCLPRMPCEVVARQLEERQQRAETLVRELRRRLEEEAARNEPGELGYVLTLEAALAAAEARLSWSTRVLSRLREYEPARSYRGEETPPDLRGPHLSPESV